MASMKKEIRDYLHLYLGCKCNHPKATSNNSWTLTPSDLLDWEAWTARGHKLILRPLSDIDTIEVFDLLGEEGVPIRGNYSHPFFQLHWEHGQSSEERYKHKYITQLTAENVRFLLSHHFDLFGLIEAGLAIDKTSLNNEQNVQGSDTTCDAQRTEPAPINN